MTPPASAISALEVPAARQPRRVRYQRIVNAVFWLFIFFGMMSLIEPSPYDLFFLLALPIWFIGGFCVHRTSMPILLAWTIFELCGFLSLMPYWDEPDPRIYQFQSFYLYMTVVFFTFFFAERTKERAEICLRAFTAGAFVSAFVSFASYLDVGGIGAALITVEGRVAGTFKDPNVFGSYLILGAAYLLQSLLLGRSRRFLFTAFGLLILLIGVFISFSRGSWGALVIALALTTISAFVTAGTHLVRIRIFRVSALVLGLGLVAILGLLANEDVRDFFFQRAAVTQDYDEGPTGRFGNQVRSIPMLLERPLGFGPLRYRLVFDLEPHNSYIGAFANDGWLGGFTWIAIVLSTAFVGFRLMFVRSPYRQLAQVFWPALFAFLLQGFQIDVDHWRQVFLCFGAIWGLEAARQRWLAQNKLPTHALRPGQSTQDQAA